MIRDGSNMIGDTRKSGTGRMAKTKQHQEGRMEEGRMEMIMYLFRITLVKCEFQV